LIVVNSPTNLAKGDPMDPILSSMAMAQIFVILFLLGLLCLVVFSGVILRILLFLCWLVAVVFKTAFYICTLDNKPLKKPYWAKQICLLKDLVAIDDEEEDSENDPVIVCKPSKEEDEEEGDNGNPFYTSIGECCRQASTQKAP
jgi:hypothetical protein